MHSRPLRVRSRRHFRRWALASLFLVNAAANADTCERVLPVDSPTIGLVLGGGGARGFAHVGVLKALEELRIPVDFVVGTSMGSIVAGLAATGMDAGEIARVVETADWDDLFTDATNREDLPLRRKADDRVGLYGPAIGIGKDSSLLPSGVIAGQKILTLFEGLTSQRAQIEDFDDLPIPYRAVATDLVSGEMVVLGSGGLSLAMRASMAVPGVFDPVREGDRVLVDGGLVRNLPVDVARELGADVVIAVNVGTPLMGADEIRNVLSIVEQLTSLSVVANTRVQIESLGPRDVLLEPPLGEQISSSDFNRFEEAWPIGYEAALARSDALSPLSLSADEYGAWRRSIVACEQAPEEIRFVRLDNRSRFSDAVIEELITLEAGDVLDTAQLDHDLRQVYSLGFIRLARYRVLREDGELGVVIEVLQDDRGTDFLQTGLTLGGSTRGTNINLQAAYLKTDIGERGSEARALVQLGDDFGLLGDFYYYLDDRRRWVFNPEVFYSRRNLLLFDETGIARAESEIDETAGALRFGREFSRHGVVFAGVRRYFGSIDVTIGPPVPTQDFDGGEWFLGGLYDRLDDRYLPTHGELASLQYLASREVLGADEEFEQLLSSFLLSRTWGRHNALLTARYNTTLAGETPPYALFTGGGFLNMSGFEPAELVGPHFGFVAAGYRYQVVQSGFMPGYVGGTLEYGNAAVTRSGIFDDGILNGSLYFGYSTPLGPLYLGYGWSEERSGVLFLRLGAALGAESVGRR